MKEKISKYLKESVQKQYFEITENDNRLIFKLHHNIPIFKSYLIVKNRKNGKRIIKQLKNSKAELSSQELFELNNLGYYDIYLKMNILNKVFLKRMKFVLSNGGKILIDKVNHRFFSSSSSAYFNLSFSYRQSSFIARAKSLKKIGDCIKLVGEIELIDDVNFDKVEILIKFEGFRKYIPCEFARNNDHVEFSADINFDIDERVLNEKLTTQIRLINEGIIIDYVGINAGKLTEFSHVKEKYLDYMLNYVPVDDVNSNKDICSALYVNPNFNLEFHVINRNDIKKLIRNEESIIKYNSKRDNKKLVFLESFHGKSYSGQPKYIYEKMLEMGLDKYYDFIWSYHGDLNIPGEPLMTMRDSDQYKNYLRESDYWITNISFPILKPNDDIIYLQTTHGTPYKHMGDDIKANDKSIPKGRVLLESGTWNYLLSPNDYSKEIFKRAFKYSGKTLNVGYPANDIFYEDNSLKIKNIKNSLKIPENKKIILYAPTFRDYNVDSNRKHQFNDFLDLQKLYDNLNEEYVILVRLHYLLSKNLDLTDELKEFIYDLSLYDDIADLYLISDILISDYSSAFFDYAHSKKPILFLVPDYDKYSEFRGLYSEVRNDLPGPEIYTNDELIESIKNIDSIMEEFEDKYAKFYEKYCGLGHGDAGEKVIKTIFKEVGK